MQVPACTSHSSAGQRRRCGADVTIRPPSRRQRYDGHLGAGLRCDRPDRPPLTHRLNDQAAPATTDHPQVAASPDPKAGSRAQLPTWQIANLLLATCSATSLLLSYGDVEQGDPPRMSCQPSLCPSASTFPVSQAGTCRARGPTNESSVHAGSVSQRSSTGMDGHPPSPTAQTKPQGAGRASRPCSWHDADGRFGLWSPRSRRKLGNPVARAGTAAFPLTDRWSIVDDRGGTKVCADHRYERSRHARPAGALRDPGRRHRQGA
jgi:hypothetical protein